MGEYYENFDCFIASLFFFEVHKHRLKKNSRVDFSIKFNIWKPDFKSGAEYISFSFKFQVSSF